LGVNDAATTAKLPTQAPGVLYQSGGFWAPRHRSSDGHPCCLTMCVIYDAIFFKKIKGGSWVRTGSFQRKRQNKWLAEVFAPTMVKKGKGSADTAKLQAIANLLNGGALQVSNSVLSLADYRPSDAGCVISEQTFSFVFASSHLRVETKFEVGVDKGNVL
jgi:hypothetical protein